MLFCLRRCKVTNNYFITHFFTEFLLDTIFVLSEMLIFAVCLTWTIMYMDSVRSLFFAVLVAVLAAACQNRPAAGPGQSSGENQADTPTVIMQIKDSTLYGRAGDCGMSTFCLVCDNGDTMYVDRTSEAGVDGTIYGDLILDDRFCMITADSNQSLVLAVNLSQLENFVKDYKVINGRLILQGANPEKGDTVRIVRLTADTLVVSDIHGERGLPRLR